MSAWAWVTGFFGAGAGARAVVGKLGRVPFLCERQSVCGAKTGGRQAFFDLPRLKNGFRIRSERVGATDAGGRRDGERLGVLFCVSKEVCDVVWFPRVH